MFALLPSAAHVRRLSTPRRVRALPLSRILPPWSHTPLHCQAQKGDSGGGQGAFGALAGLKQTLEEEEKTNPRPPPKAANKQPTAAEKKAVEVGWGIADCPLACNFPDAQLLHYPGRDGRGVMGTPESADCLPCAVMGCAPSGQKEGRNSGAGAGNQPRERREDSHSDIGHTGG